MSEYIQSHMQSFLNILQMYLKTLFLVDKLINYAFISCAQLGKGYYYGMVAYSNTIISLWVVHYCVENFKLLQLINHKLLFCLMLNVLMQYSVGRHNTNDHTTLTTFITCYKYLLNYKMHCKHIKTLVWVYPTS